uniref:Uncharacterized protein n=1 Tax=Timema poppense TaxID=170557 RepID=A0A7R9GX26_TIMPO|nr:unnamed protein product [Timema poppensis]
MYAQQGHIRQKRFPLPQLTNNTRRKNSLEEVGVVVETEEGHGIGQHPDVPPAAVIVGLTPLAVLVRDTEDLVRDSVRMGRLVVRVHHPVPQPSVHPCGGGNINYNIPIFQDLAWCNTNMTGNIPTRSEWTEWIAQKL